MTLFSLKCHLLWKKEEWKMIGVWPKKGRGHREGEISAIKIFCFADKRGMKDFLYTGNRGPSGTVADWEMPSAVHRNSRKQTAPTWHKSQKKRGGKWRAREG